MTIAHPDEEPLSRRQRKLLVVLPLIGLGVAYLVAHVVAGPSRAREMVAAALANLLGLGTTVIFGGLIVGEHGFNHLTAWDLAIVVVVLDGLLTVIYIGIADLVERIPWAGPKFASARKKARAHAREHPWIRHWAVLGVALFILSPAPGSGVIAGSIFGHVVGLSRWRTFLTVTLANLVVCAIYAWGADSLGAWMTRSDWSLGQRIALLAGALALVLLLLKLVTGGFHRAKPAK